MCSSIYKNEISSITAELDSTEKKRAEIEKKLKDKEDRIQLLHMKELLLGKIVLYRHYQAESQREDTSEARKLYQDTGDELYKLVTGFVNKTIEGEAKPIVEVHIGKGIQQSLTFEFDKAVVPLPREKFATLD